jgi:hypothetical protein
MKKTVTQYLNIESDGHKDIDFVDIYIKPDTKLFIDPCLVEISNDQWCKQAQKTVDSFFDALYLNYKKTAAGSDVISKLLEHSREINDSHLGYGNGKNGRGNTAEGMMKILAKVPTLIASGIEMDAPIDLTLFVSDFAEDGLSDMLTNILYKELSEFTIQQCAKYGISTTPIDADRYYWDINTESWQRYLGHCLKIADEIVILIPKNIVRKSYYYNTSQYFSSVIVSRIQKDKTEYHDGKAVTPKKKDIKKEEYETYGSVIEAARAHTMEKPKGLSFYHDNVFAAYKDKNMTDDELDDFIYRKTSNAKKEDE